MSASVVTAAILQASGAGTHALEGPNMLAIAKAVGGAVAQWPVGLSGVVAGPVGIGQVVKGSVLVPSVPTLVLASLIGAGVAGPLASSLATVLATGLSNAFQTAVYEGSAPGVATGVDVAKVTVADGNTLSALLAPLLAGGPLAVPLAVGIGQGLAAMVLTGSGTGSVIGVPAIPSVPAVSPTTSQVL